MFCARFTPTKPFNDKLCETASAIHPETYGVTHD